MRALWPWAEPLLLAGVTLAGLGLALLAGAMGGVAGDLLLAVPPLAILRRILRATRSSRPR
jgi:hypothetical protein